MSVEEVYCGGTLFRIHEMTALDKRHHLLMTALALSNDAQADADGVLIGDPTETALYDSARKHGFDRREREKKYPRVAEIPFDSDRKCMTTVHAWDGGFVSFTKGAIEGLLDTSADMITAEGVQPLHADAVRTTYAIAQADPGEAWDLVSAVCDDGSSPASVTLDPGEIVTCTFTNVKRGQILIDEVTVPTGEAQSFSFALTGGPDAVSQAFSLTDAAAPH